jgi:hypothetical protein
VKNAGAWVLTAFGVVAAGAIVFAAWKGGVFK